MLTQQRQSKTADHVVVEKGRKANAIVYEALKRQSKNRGEININMLVEGCLILPESNSKGKFDLVRIGDAVSARNIHAAVYDALRLGSL